jgi:outer membrane protein assembly factor BamB
VWAIGSKSWPMWRRDPEHTATGQSGPANLTLRWNFTAGGGIVSSPSVVDRRVYVGSQDRNIYCLDARSGRFLWNFKTGFRIKSSPAVVDGKVYIGPDDGYIYCLDAKNGSLLWKRYAGGYVPAHFDAATKLCSSPTVVEGKIYVGALDTNVYCLDANNGTAMWIYETAGYITSSPAVVDGEVYITSQEPTSAALYKLDANNGSLVWKLEIPYQLIAERGTDMHASPTVAEGMVFTSANKLEYYGVNATTGEIEWTYRNLAEEFIVSSPTYHDGRLFFIDQFFVVSVDAKSGQPIWKSWLGGEMYVSPTYADGKLYVASDRRAIYVLNATNGDKLSWFETGSNSWSSPTIYEGRVYVGNQDWNLYCLDDYPIISTPITVELDKGEVEIGETVTGSGSLAPTIGYAPITVTFVKSDGSIDDIQVASVENGAFHFAYTTDMVGNWTVTAWCSGAAYICRSSDLVLSVVESQQPPPSNWLGIPKEHVYAAVAIVAVAVIIVAAFLLRKKRQKI